MWKYALIKIEHEDLWESEEYCELVELYQSEPGGDYTSFSQAHLDSVERVKKAYEDVTRDGVNTWFAENGKFDWCHDQKFWDWIPNDAEV
tara:strand:+ start:270 stop:539 length:270 start_codon:yes stop_codon:yes gene_type:complete